MPWLVRGDVDGFFGLALDDTAGDTAILLAPAWPWVSGYLAVAGLLFLAPVVTEPGATHG